jgi:uncharacterized membrane protein
MKNKTVRDLVYSALIAAIYSALTLCLAPFSFGSLQFRIAEALTLLPILSSNYIIGLTLGCAVSNAVGFFMGVNILGAFDIVFGTLATLLAAVCTYLCRNLRFKKLPIISALFPAVFNGVLIGAELCFLLNGSFSLPIFLTQGLLVAIPELIICMTFGLYLVRFLEKRSI